MDARPSSRTVPLAALLVVALGALQLTLIGTVSPAVVTALGGADLYTLLVLGCIAASVAGALVALLPAVGRRGRAGVVELAAWLLAIGSLVVGIAPSMPVVVVGRLVTGFGAGLAFAGGFAAVDETADARWRRSLLAAAAATFAIAFEIAPLVGLVLTDALGWRAPALLAAVAAAIAVPLARRAGGPAAAVEPGRAALAAADPADPADPAPSAVGHAARLLATGLAAGAVFGSLAFVPLAPFMSGGGLAAAATLAALLAVGLAVGAAAWAAWDRTAGGNGGSVPLVRAVSPDLALVAGLVILVLADTAGGPVPATVAVPLAGVGIGLSLAASVAGPRSLAAAARRAGSVQAGGLVGLLAAGGAFVVILQTKLLDNLRALIDLALPFIPAAVRDQAKTLAEDALNQIGRSLDPATIANVGGSFAQQLLDRAPADLRQYVEPYLASVDQAFQAASRSALQATYLVALGFAVVATLLVIGVAIGERRRRRPATVAPAVHAAP